MTTEEKKNGKRAVYVGDLKNGASQPVILSLMGLDMEAHDPIRVIVNSYGGYIDEMFAIYDAMKLCESPIVTVGIGKIMSAGVLLLSAGVKGERRIARNAIVMIHELSAGAWGKLYEIETEMEQWKRDQQRMVTALARECRCKVSVVRAMMETHKNTYLTASEAKGYGIVDKVV